MSRSRIIGGLLAASVATTGVVIGGGMASAGDPTPVPIAALEHGLRATLPAQVEQLSKSGDIAPFKPDVREARRLRTPDGLAGSWFLVPAEDGTCLVAPSNAMVCAPPEAVRTGRLMGISAPEALPERLTPEQVARARAGEPIGGGSFKGSSVVGVAPDGVTSVVLRDRDGAAIATSPVVENAYGVSDVDMGAVASVELVRAQSSG